MPTASRYQESIKRVDQTTRVSCADRARSICKAKEMSGSYFDHGRLAGWLTGSYFDQNDRVSKSNINDLTVCDFFSENGLKRFGCGRALGTV